MKNVELDGLSLDYIRTHISNDEHTEKEIIKAVEQMLQDCDKRLIDLIEEYF